MGSRYGAVVRNPRGSHFRTIGKVGPDGLMRLLPEEALYLLERGSLDLRWPAMRGEGDEDDDRDGDEDEDGGEDESVEQDEDKDEDEDGEDEEHNDEDEDGDEYAESRTEMDAMASVIGADVPLSLQAAYACLVGRSGLTLERYIVYAGLKRSGYIVQRGPAWDSEDDVDVVDVGTTSQVANASTQQLLERKPLARFGWLYRSIFGASSKHPPPRGPLVAPGLYRSYGWSLHKFSSHPAIFVRSTFWLISVAAAHVLD